MTREGSEADTLPAESRLGQVVAGKYRIERLLGRGGMGEVYEARHVLLGRRFAVKFLHAHLARGERAGSRFLREARAAGSLDSPHIAAVLDFDTAPDGSPFLVMEYLTGESLNVTLLREGRLPLARAIAILLQVCDGLEVAHRAGIVHRDLKPDNLLLTHQKDGTDSVKILDFGIAKLVDGDADGNVTQSGAVLGTPFYMAPEQARGDKAIDLRVDVYALGVLAYELLSGQKPHPGDGHNAILAHILTQPITPLNELRPELPPALVAVIQQALAFEPARRPASAALLAAALVPFAGRAVAMSDSHFDLRPPVTGLDGPATRATSDLPPPSPVGTLSSAVGDVRASRTGQPPASRARWLLLAIALPAAALVAAKIRGEASAPARPVSMSTGPGGVPQASAPSALPVPRPLPPPGAVISGAPPAAGSTTTTPKRTNPAPVTSSRRRPPTTETPFDEKNPY